MVTSCVSGFPLLPPLRSRVSGERYPVVVHLSRVRAIVHCAVRGAGPEADGAEPKLDHQDSGQSVLRSTYGSSYSVLCTDMSGGKVEPGVRRAAGTQRSYTMQCVGIK